MRVRASWHTTWSLPLSPGSSELRQVSLFDLPKNKKLEKGQRGGKVKDHIICKFPIWEINEFSRGRVDFIKYIVASALKRLYTVFPHIVSALE